MYNFLDINPSKNESSAMGEKKQVLRTEPVKQYLIQCSMKAGSEQVRLMEEMELCRKFGVSRGTVRQAIEETIRLGYATRLPKRRGLFSLPGNSRIPEKCRMIALLYDNQTFFVLTRHDAAMVSAFFEELTQYPCNFCVPRMNEFTEESILGLEMDGLVWFHPPKENAPLIRQLIGRGYPIVAVPFFYSDSFDTDPDHYLYVDYLGAAKKRAEVFAWNNCRNLLICGGSSPSIILLEKEFRKTPLAENVFISDGTPSSLQTILRNENIDAIFSFGGIDIYQTVFQVVRSLPDPRKILIQIDPGFLEDSLIKKNPDLHIVNGDFTDLHIARARDVGKEAALRLKKILKNKEVRKG